MPYDESVAKRVASYFDTHRTPYEAKRMMGGLCFMVRGKMCVGVESHRLMVRLDPALQEGALHRPGCRPMDFTGRPMRGFVFVDAAHLCSDASLAEWLDLALAFNPAAKSSRRKKSSRRSRIEPLKPFRENLRTSKSATAGELAAQLNLGPKSAAWLHAAGLRSRADVARLGVIETCRRVRARGHPASVLLAYALEGALAGCHWNAIPWETKQFLRAEFGRMKRVQSRARLTPRSGARSS